MSPQSSIANGPLGSRQGRGRIASSATELACSRPRTVAARVREEGGWVMVPVMALLALALLLSFAALLLVDRQTSAAQAQRTNDASQTLAEGALNATAGILAGDGKNTEWRRAATPPQPCTTVTGDLNGKRTGTAGSFERAVQDGVDDYFKAAKAGETALTDYDTKGGASTAWRVEVCSTTADPTTDARWDDAAKSTRVGPTGSVAGRKQLWVRAQADVRPKTSSSGTASLSNSRAVAAKVQQDGKGFAPPEAFGVGTGSFSTDVGTSLPNLLHGLTQESPLLGNSLGTLLGTSKSPVIASTAAKIGVRCGLANVVEGLTTDPNGPLDLDLCLSGVLAGVDGVTSLLGLNSLLNTVGVNTNRFASLDGLRMAPEAAIEAYRDAAQSSNGVYRAASNSPTGVGNVRTPPATLGAVPSCLTPSDWTKLNSQPNPSESVVFIEQVGDGEQYCAIDPDTRAKIFVVNRGGVVIRGTGSGAAAKFTGVVYALNGNETSEATRVKRELVRIESPGQVFGSVWVDGAKGQVGTYAPSVNSSVTTFNNSLTASLATLTGPVDNTLCTLANSSGVLGALLGPVVDLVGNLVGAVLNIGTNTQKWIRPTSIGKPGNGVSPPDQTGQACGLVKNALSSVGGNTVVAGEDVDKTIPTTVWKRTQTCVTSLLCFGWSDWSQDSTGTQPVELTSGLLSGVLGAGNLLGNLLSGIENTFENTPPAIQHDLTTIQNAAVLLPDNAALVPGTFRNLPPAPAA